MSKQDTLSKEIEELERGAYGNPASEEAANTEEVKKEVEASEGTAQNEESPEEEPTEFAQEEATAQEDTFDTEAEETPTKPQRKSWKKEYKQLEHRWKSQKASSDATIFQLRTDLSKALNSSNALSDKVDELSKQLAEITSKQPLPDVLTDEQKEIVGIDTLDAISKTTQASIDAQVTPLKEQLAFEREQRKKDSEAQATTQAQQAHQEYLARLTAVVPDYLQIDKSVEWLDWMKLPDPISGSKRETLFLQAQSVGDVGRVAHFFNEFKSLKNAGQETLDKKVTPKSQTSENAQKVQIQKPASKPVYISMAKISQFLEDVNRGKYKGREKFVGEMNAIIDQAQRDGRIVA